MEYESQLRMLRRRKGRSRRQVKDMASRIFELDKRQTRIIRRTENMASDECRV